MDKFDFLVSVAGQMTLSLWVGVLTTLVLSMLVVTTTRWHGFLSLDESIGIQKIHISPTPRIGGLPIVVGLLIAVLASPKNIQLEVMPWLLTGFPVFVLGFTEDLTKRISISARLLITIASGVFACMLTGYSLTNINVWGIDWLLQYPLFTVLFTAFAVGGLTNAVNIIDGLNGLASSMVIWALLGLALLAANLEDYLLVSTCLLLVACVLGFFVVNWPLGKLFLGDGGSYFLGFTLAWVCVLLVERHSNVSAFTALLLCIHPIIEVLYSIYRRKIRHQHLGQPDRLHFHSLVKRRLMQRLLPHSSKIIRNSLGGLMVGGMSLLPAVLVQFTYSSTPISLMAVILLSILYVWYYKCMVVRLNT